MKTIAQYQNRTPAEIAHQYRKGLRAKQGLLILVLLLYVIDNIRGIWWADASLANVLLKSLILIVITFPINIWISWDFMSLNLILSQACDPVTYVQVMRLLEDINVHKRKRNALAIRINEASGLMWSGQFSDALALAESLRKYKVSNSSQISLLNIRFNCHKKMDDLERAMQVKQEAEVFVSTLTKASMQKAGQELLNIMDASLALQRGDYETFRAVSET